MVMMSPERSLARSGLMKHASEESAMPASYMLGELRSFLIMFVVSISTSVSGWKLCTAARYPIRFSVNLLELMTSMTLNPAHEMS